MSLRYICIPKRLAEQDFFKSGSKPLRDRLAGFCIVMLIKRCRACRTSGIRQWRYIHSGVISKYLNPNLTTSVKDTLIAAKIIECNNSYQVDYRSFGYRFAKGIKKNAFEHYAFETIRAVDRFRKAERRKKTKYKLKLGIRGPATPTIIRLYELMTRLELPEEQMLKAVDSVSLEDRLYHYRQGNAFHRGQLYAKVDDTGRFYTSLTSLWKKHRHLLRIQNEPLVEIDVSACQPLMLSLMVEPFVSMSECIRFRELTESGSLYDKIAEFTGRPRDRAKRGFLSFLCADIPRNGFQDRRPTKVSLRALILAWFKQRFPEIADYLIDTKSSEQSRMKMNTEIRREAGKKTSAYAITAFDMQRLEAEIMIEGVCAQFMKQHPNEFIATIHDAVMVKEEMAFAAEQIMKEQFKKRGLNPRVGITMGGEELKSRREREERGGATMFNAFSTRPTPLAQSFVAP